MEFKDVKKVLEREFAEIKKVKVKVYDTNGTLKYSKIYNPNIETEYNALKKLEKVTLKDGYIEFMESLNCFGADGREIFKEDIIIIDSLEYVVLNYNEKLGLLVMNGLEKKYIKGEKMRRSQIQYKL